MNHYPVLLLFYLLHQAKEKLTNPWRPWSLTMKYIFPNIIALYLLFNWSAWAEKPNILFIISDDQAPDTIRALGNKHIQTPNLDRLVRAGTSFTHCFNQGSWSGAVCVASRTMLITGQSVYRAPRNKAIWIHGLMPKVCLPLRCKNLSQPGLKFFARVDIKLFFRGNGTTTHM